MTTNEQITEQATEQSGNQVEQTSVKFEELKYVAKLDVPAGKRLCRIINKKGVMSVGAHVPALTINDTSWLLENPATNRWIVDQLQGIQDKIARKFMQEAKTNVIDLADFTNLQTIINYIAAEQETAGRLSKDAILAWFNADLAGLIAKAVQAKGITQKAQIDATVAAYASYFASLAGKSPSMSEKIKGQLEKALALLPEDYENAIAEKIAGILVEVKEQVAELDAL